MNTKRAIGVCNCPHRKKGEKVICELDGRRCRVMSDKRGIYCRGWLPSGKPATAQQLKITI